MVATQSFGGRSDKSMYKVGDKSGARPVGWFSEERDDSYYVPQSRRAGTGTVHGDVMAHGVKGRNDDWYATADNDADNYDPTLNSSHAAYYQNPDNTAAYGENRWKTGGGIETGGATGLHAGRTRDTDGTVDRVKDPGPELYPILYAVKMQASAYNIPLDETFEAAGGNQRGTIPATRFFSALSSGFHRLDLTEDILWKLGNHYGTGDRAPWHGGKPSAKAIAAPFECIAWKDFIEDVRAAQDPYANIPGRPGGPKPMYPRGVQYG